MKQLDIEALDQQDCLAHKRREFVLPSETIYLDGNSLGPLTVQAQRRVRDVTEQQWGSDLIQSWNKHGWIDLAQRCGEKIAPLLGAAAGQVVCCDSVSVNLFKLLACAMQLNPERNKIVSQAANFPTDLYMLEGLQRMLGAQHCQIELSSSEDLQSCLDDSVAVLLLTQVDFRSGEMLDIAEWTAAAHQHGIQVVWDLSHSAGALELELDHWRVDFAVGCGYKYFNGGPGAPAFVYVNAKHQPNIEQPLSGWMGHRAPFEFEPAYQAASGVKKFLSGTPNILSLAALDASLEVFADVSMAQLRAKSIGLSQAFLQLLTSAPELHELRCVSPLDAQQRGSQLSFEFNHAYGLCQALIERGVIGDFRAPNIIRFGFAPLYLSYADIAQAVAIMIDVISHEGHLEARHSERKAVT